jgi:hypothetical protein
VEARLRDVVRLQNVRGDRSHAGRSGCGRLHRSPGSVGAGAPSPGGATTVPGAGRSQPWLGVRWSSAASPSPSQARRVENVRLSRCTESLIGPGAGGARGPMTNTQIVGRSDALDLGARTRQLNDCSTSPRRLSARVGTRTRRDGGEGLSLFGSATVRGRLQSGTALVAVEGSGDEAGEARRGSADRRVELAIDDLGTEHEPGSQVRPDATTLVDAAQGVRRLGQAHGHAVKLAAEAAHREEHAPSHLGPEGLGEGEIRAPDVDSQSRSGGMVPKLPSWPPAV